MSGLLLYDIILTIMNALDKNNLPVTIDSTLENARRWLNIVRYGESGCIIQLQDDCEFRVPQVIENKAILKKFLGPYYRKYLLLYIPSSQKNLLDEIKLHLYSLSNSRKIFFPDMEKRGPADLLSEIGKKGFEVGIFISKLTDVLREKNYSTLKKLEYLVEKTKNFSVILFVEEDITHPKYRPLIDKCSLLFDHIIKYKFYQKDDICQFIDYYSNLWKLTIGKNLKEEIVCQCGGYLWLVSQILRLIRDKNIKKIQEAYKDDGLLLKLEVVWSKFTAAQKDILAKAFFGSMTPQDLSSHDFQFLLEINALTKKTGSFAPSIPLLELVVKKEKLANKLKLMKNAVYFQDKNVSSELSPKEYKFLKLLLQNRKTIVSRTKVAENLWRENWQEKYSDWAIDRLAYRLRGKLQQFGLEKNLLKTIKRKGFILG